MQAKVKVEICIGTSCHLMGSPLIIEFLENLPESVKVRLNIVYATCLKRCQEGPRLTIGGRSLTRATPEMVLKTLQALGVA